MDDKALTACINFVKPYEEVKFKHSILMWFHLYPADRHVHSYLLVLAEGGDAALA